MLYLHNLSFAERPLKIVKCWKLSVLTISACCFQELVTDSPFIISPRITFEVSVRLLGGLMALGYTIAAILKRSSHVFCNDRVCVKIDWLEQLNRKYVQVFCQLLHLLV